MKYWKSPQDWGMEEAPWVKKNPEITLNVDQEKDLDDKEWSELRFPFFPLPERVSTHVRCRKWEEMVDGVREFVIC